jgi:Mannose-6-phosphate isomerase
MPTFGWGQDDLTERTQLPPLRQLVYLPLGVDHRLENPTSDPLEIIEVQTGSDLAENDIVRVENDYRRRPDK